MAVHRGTDGVVRFGNLQIAIAAIEQHSSYIIQEKGNTVWSGFGVSGTPEVGDIFVATKNGTGDSTSGKVAKIDLVASTRSWTLNVARNTIEIPTTAGEEIVSNFAHTIQGSGTVELLFTAGGNETEDFLNAVNQGWKSYKPTGFELYLETPTVDATTVTDKKIQFQGIVTSADFSATVNEVEIVTVNFVTTGKITTIVGAE